MSRHINDRREPCTESLLYIPEPDALIHRDRSPLCIDPSLPAVPNEPLFSAAAEGLSSQIRIHDSRSWTKWATRIFAIVAIPVTAFTLLYAWNASIPSSRLQYLLWEDPQRTVLTINILSQTSMVLLSGLSVVAWENLRRVHLRQGSSSSLRLRENMEACNTVLSPCASRLKENKLKRWSWIFLGVTRSEIPLMPFLKS